MSVNTAGASGSLQALLTRRAKRRRVAVRLALLFAISALGAMHSAPGAQREQKADFYPAWAAHARYLQPLQVMDTDSALGRFNLYPKEITLKDMARMHGHLCDGLVTAWVELSAALRALFPDGVVDRTDLRVESKNGPCWADAGAWMTGARINQGTLVLDNAVGDGFIVQRISSGQAVRVALRPGVYPAQLAALEQSIRARRAGGVAVAPDEIDRFERGASEYSRKLLNTPPDQAVAIERLADFHFPDHSRNPVAPRSDIINRDAPRSDRGAGSGTR